MSGRGRSPAMVVALVALVLAAGGLAAAAIPDSNGVIHACYAKSDGALRIAKGTKCQPGEKRLSWNQGIGRVTTRSAKLRLTYQQCSPKMSSTYTTTPMFSCTAASKTGIVRCAKHERATGGGYGKPTDGSWPSFNESKPFHTFGTPSGWTLSASATADSSSSAHPDTVVPIYAVCAAP